MTVSAEVRLSPSPPARVVSKKTKRSESLAENRSTARWRSFPRVLPSSRSYKYFSLTNNFSRTSKTPFICEKMSTRRPSSFSLGNSLLSSTNFPEAATSFCAYTSGESSRLTSFSSVPLMSQG